MSFLATNPNQTVDHPGSQVIAGDKTPTPAPSAAEIVSALFPSDAGGVEYLFGGGSAAAVPTPLEDVPVTRPNEAALAMSASGEGMTVHVSGPPDVPTPVAGGQTGVALSEPPAAAPAPRGLFATTFAGEGARLRSMFARLGGGTAGGG